MVNGGEWVVNISDMDAGLVSYTERERVMLVIGGKFGLLLYTGIHILKASL
jgi:hypothetical protein